MKSGSILLTEAYALSRIACLSVLRAFAVFVVLGTTPVMAGFLEAGRDVVYRFDTGTPMEAINQVDFLFGSPLAPGAGFSMKWGTTPGGSSLGADSFENPFSFPISGVGTGPNCCSWIDTLSSPTGYTYLTIGYTGTEVGVVAQRIWFIQGQRVVEGREISMPQAFASRPIPSPDQLGASVITSFRNYVEGSQNTERTYLERINDCAAQGPNCDFDATANDQEFRQNLQNAADATYASRDLVTRTSLLPQNKLELAADVPTLTREIRAFFQWIGLLPENENRDQVINAAVEGESGEFTVNPTFKSYALTYFLDFNSSSFFTDVVGETFLFDLPIDDGRFFTGYGLVESVETLDTGGQRAIFSIVQLESDDLYATVPRLVEIDIQPGSYPNSINPNSKGKIPVAILTTDTFDATQVDWEAVSFGPDGATEYHGRSHVEDADSDGDMDVVFHFKTQDTGFACGDTEATLVGQTFDGQSLTGSDSIKIVECH